MVALLVVMFKDYSAFIYHAVLFVLDTPLGSMHTNYSQQWGQCGLAPTCKKRY